jgi:hypothetical protein
LSEDSEKQDETCTSKHDEDKDKNPTERPSGVRWWEQYTVRYFVGTVIGLLVIAALKSDAQLKWTSLIPDVGVAGLADPRKLTVLAVIGLAFCYVASAPILTLHAVRGAYALDRRGYFVFLVALVASPFALMLIAAKLGAGVAGKGALLLIVGLQIVLIFVASAERFGSTKRFYDCLVIARHTDWKNRTDYADSYRHLREHGNALGIVLLELALGSILGTLQTKSEALTAVILWIIPGAWCWVIGNVLESHFARRDLDADTIPQAQTRKSNK